MEVSVALVGAAAVGVTSYAFTVPSIRTATLCTPSQLPVSYTHLLSKRKKSSRELSMSVILLEACRLLSA